MFDFETKNGLSGRKDILPCVRVESEMRTLIPWKKVGLRLPVTSQRSLSALLRAGERAPLKPMFAIWNREG